MDRSKDKVGYEINFNRHFYKYTPPRSLEEIDAELKQAEEGDLAVAAGGDGVIGQVVSPFPAKLETCRLAAAIARRRK